MSGMTRKIKDIGNEERERFPTKDFGNNSVEGVS